MALRGDLSDIALPDVLRLVALSDETGALHLSREGAEGVVSFREGRVVLARSDHASAPLGTMLVDAGVLERADLERALRLRDEESGSGRRIGEVLLDMGVLTAQTLDAFMREQIREAIGDLLGWGSGHYEFKPSVPGAGSESGPMVPVEDLLGEREGRRRDLGWGDRALAPESASWSDSRASLTEELMGLTGGERSSVWRSPEAQVPQDPGTSDGPHRDPLLDPEVLRRTLDVLRDL